MKENSKHSFFIPVMGIGYSIDTPAKVAHFGISSVISLVDDIIIEKMRNYYSQKFNLPFEEISNKMEDFRAKRIREYLNLIDKIINDKIEEMKSSFREKSDDLRKYFSMMPEASNLKAEFESMIENSAYWDKLQLWLKDHLQAGSIDVNIMTKVDGSKFKNGEQLPIEYNEGHAALRGFATSNIQGSIVLSAGMNPRLYGYMENFEDFFPTTDAFLKKQIILKVSDYRSAIIQGKFLARKGLWVSEYRIESGLNCGGHAFASDGFLMGPILEEFRTKREQLIQDIFPVYIKALEKKERILPKHAPQMKITAQGGVGTNEEHYFLLDHYGLDGVGWGTPFMNVPEATNVDSITQKLLLDAKEDDLYLSEISPLGVPFNSVRGNTKDIERDMWVEEGHPGSPCSHKHVEIDTEFTDKPICKASRQYQTLKIKELKKLNLPIEDYKKKFDKIVEKACICVGLGTPALLVNELDHKIEGDGVSTCPGPNMAYFSKIVSLKEMVGHIYGRNNIIDRNDRPNMFIKELTLYVDYLKNKFGELQDDYSEKQEKYLHTFRENLHSGIEYYKTLFSEKEHHFTHMKDELINELKKIEKYLKNLNSK